MRWNALTTVHHANEAPRAGGVPVPARRPRARSSSSSSPSSSGPSPGRHPDRRPGHRALGLPGGLRARSWSRCSTSGCAATSGAVYVQMFDTTLANFVGVAGRAVRPRRDLWHRPRPRAQRRPLLLRPLRRARATSSATSPDPRCSSWSHPRSRSPSARPSATPCPAYCRQLRRAVRLQRRLPEGPLHHDPRRRARPALPVPQLPGVLPARRPARCASWPPPCAAAASPRKSSPGWPAWTTGQPPRTDPALERTQRLQGIAECARSGAGNWPRSEGRGPTESVHAHRPRPCPRRARPGSGLPGRHRGERRSLARGAGRPAIRRGGRRRRPGAHRARRGVPRRRGAAAAHKETAHYATWRDGRQPDDGRTPHVDEVLRGVPGRGWPLGDTGREHAFDLSPSAGRISFGPGRVADLPVIVAGLGYRGLVVTGGIRPGRSTCSRP